MIYLLTQFNKYVKWKIIRIENILTLNQSIFGTKSRERRISKIALKASVKELYVPQESEEITYDDGYEFLDGNKLFEFKEWLVW